MGHSCCWSRSRLRETILHEPKWREGEQRLSSNFRCWWSLFRYQIKFEASSSLSFRPLSLWLPLYWDTFVVTSLKPLCLRQEHVSYFPLSWWCICCCSAWARWSFLFKFLHPSVWQVFLSVITWFWSPLFLSEGLFSFSLWGSAHFRGLIVQEDLVKHLCCPTRQVASGFSLLPWRRSSCHLPLLWCWPQHWPWGCRRDGWSHSEIWLLADHLFSISNETQRQRFCDSGTV